MGNPGEERAVKGQLEFRVLGPLEVLQTGEPVPLGGTKQKALLAILLIHAGEVMSADRLIDALWGADPPPTAGNILQTYVSRLRKLLNRLEPVLVSRRPGYVLNVEPGQLDLHRFEQFAERGRSALAEGRASEAATHFRQALDLWRGRPLAEFAYEEFAQPEIERLEEFHLSVLEDRIEADLVTGRHGQLVAELEALSIEYPLRERLPRQLMLALYRSGRQAEALEVYQTTKRVLGDELGIDPSPELQRLEHSILNQDPGLEWHASPTDRRPSRPAPTGPPAATLREPAPERSIVIAVEDGQTFSGLLKVAELLTGTSPRHELILAWLLPKSATSADLARTTNEVNEHRSKLSARGMWCRAVSFTTSDPGQDLDSLAKRFAAELVILDGRDALTKGGLFRGLALDALNEVDTDVAILLGARDQAAAIASAVLVPFGGGDHDWVALQLGAWVAGAQGGSLRLVGTAANFQESRRDASRLLADAALIAQRATGVVTEPLLAQAGEELAKAAHEASLLVIGLSDRWRDEGLGRVRQSLATTAEAPTLLLRRGPRSTAPGADTEMSRYTWSGAVR